MWRPVGGTAKISASLKLQVTELLAADVRIVHSSCKGCIELAGINIKVVMFVNGTPVVKGNNWPTAFAALKARHPAITSRRSRFLIYRIRAAFPHHPERRALARSPASGRQSSKWLTQCGVNNSGGWRLPLPRHGFTFTGSRHFS